MDSLSFILGMVIGAILCLFFIFIGAYPEVQGKKEDFNAFIKVCPQYDIGFYNDTYKLSCDNGVIELAPNLYNKLTNNLN
ncbi:hypothetical protein AB7281_21425 [Providencia rettgeri]